MDSCSHPHVVVTGASSGIGRAGLDGLVNNAGIGVFGPLETIPLGQFRTLMEVNVTGSSPPPRPSCRCCARRAAVSS